MNQIVWKKPTERQGPGYKHIEDGHIGNLRAFRIYIDTEHVYPGVPFQQPKLLCCGVGKTGNIMTHGRTQKEQIENLKIRAMHIWQDHWKAITAN